MNIETSETGQYFIIRVNIKLDLYNIGEFKKVMYDSTSGKYTDLAVELRHNNMGKWFRALSAL